MFQTLEIAQKIKIELHLIDLASVEQVKIVTWGWIFLDQKIQKHV